MTYASVLLFLLFLFRFFFFFFVCVCVCVMHEGLSPHADGATLSPTVVSSTPMPQSVCMYFVGSCCRRRCSPARRLSGWRLGSLILGLGRARRAFSHFFSKESGRYCSLFFFSAGWAQERYKSLSVAEFIAY